MHLITLDDTHTHSIILLLVIFIHVNVDCKGTEVREVNFHDKHQTRGTDPTDSDIIICRGSWRGTMALVIQQWNLWTITLLITNNMGESFHQFFKYIRINFSLHTLPESHVISCISSKYWYVRCT